MTLITKTKGELMEEARSFLQSNTQLTNFSPGSVVRSILEVFTSQLAEQYDVMNANLLQTYVTTAVGTSLDNIGAIFGMSRRSAKRAEDVSRTNFRFYIDPNTGFTGSQLAAIQYTANQSASITSQYVSSSAFTIPRGTIVRSGNLEFATTADAVFSGTETSVSVPIVSSGYGADYNVPAYSIKTYVLGSREFVLISNYLKCENRQAIVNGSFIEDDASYRRRIMGAHLASQKANLTAVRLAALSVPGVSDVIIQEYSAGIGTFSLYIIADTPIPSDGMLAAVEQAVNFDKALGAKAIVGRPRYRGFEGRFKIDYDPSATPAEKTTLENQARIALELYINNVGIGQILYANRMIERILALSSKIKDVSVITFGAGEFDPDTYKNKKFRPLFFMNQKLSVDEQPLAVPGRIVVC